MSFAAAAAVTVIYLFAIWRSIVVLIYNVVSNSPADKAGIKKDDRVVSINENEIFDVLDYNFYAAEKDPCIKVLRGADVLSFKVKKGQYDDLGLEFETFLMDEKRSCKNKCIFCFIDQNPKNLRETIYFKDDDYRLSFLMGNYVTLTNVTQNDLQRIAKMHLSPINVSVHTTDPELRKTMLNNRFAGDILEKIEFLTKNRIFVNAQIVLCKGVNDKEALTNTVTELSEFFPYLQSIAVVPAGLTKHREGLFPLEPFTKEEAKGVVLQVEKLSRSFLRKFHTRLVFAADEFYIKADLPLPKEKEYEDFSQLDNGVGLIRLDEGEILNEIKRIKKECFVPKRRSVCLITGEAAYSYIKEICERITQAFPEISCTALSAMNEFFGRSVTVAGLLTGSDFSRVIKTLPEFDEIILPRAALRHEGDLFLDGMSTEELQQITKTPIIYSENGVDILHKILDY